MTTLKTDRLKPNPAGKDKDRAGRPIPSQLAAEWVDIKNASSTTVKMDGVTLYHVAFRNGNPSHWEKVIGFKGMLEAGKVVRVHAGSGPARPEDLAGADFHLYTNEDRFVWNNAEGDTSRLTRKVDGDESEIDKASYDPYPPEGVVLQRVGNKLVPAAATARR